MEKQSPSSRSLRRSRCLPLGVLAVLACCAGEAGDEPVVGEGPSSVALVEPGEPGTPLVLTGRVFETDRTTPVSGARLEVYQTDAEGYYTRPVSVPRNARIRGSVWTDETGRYEIRTILPGSYPDQQEAAHVHVHLAAPGIRDHWIPSFLFEGDPHLTARDREANAGLGSFSAIVTLEEGEDGVLRGARDILLDPDLAEENYLVDGWYQGE